MDRSNSSISRQIHQSLLPSPFWFKPCGLKPLRLNSPWASQRHMVERSLPAAQGRANVQKEISDHLASIVLSLDEEEKDERRRDLEEFLRLTAVEQGMDQMNDHSHAFIAELTADERCPIPARLYFIYELSNARMKVHDKDGRN